MANSKILVVEDEADILELIRYNFEREGYVIVTAANGEDALRLVPAEKPDLVLLDLMLPGVDGLDVCRELKREPETAKIPIIMVTAKGEESDVVAGLELGADDYVAKPFSMKILIARVRMVLRRRHQREPDNRSVLQIHELVINPDYHEVRVQGKPVDLTSTEFSLLHVLARRPGRVLTRDQIIDAVKGEDYAVTDRAVDVQIVGLRKKLGPCSDCIQTVRGVGYRCRE
jgi:two-component system, OmpR family, alkaline phosphatase synthesis response regulator PhoP